MMNISLSEKNRWCIGLLIVIMAYCVAQGLMLAVPGAWWDDALMWSDPEYSLNTVYDEDHANSPFMREMIRLFIIGDSNLDDRFFFFRWFPFVLGLLSVVLIYFNLRIISENFSITLLTSLVAAVSCFDKTKLLFICLPYAASLFLTLLGLLAFIYDFKSPKFFYKIISAVSWCTAIMIWRSPIAVLPYVIALASCIKVSFNFKEAQSYLSVVTYALRNYWLIILLYIIAVLVFLTALKPGNQYAEYYTINPSNVIFSPITTLTNCLSFFIQYICDMLKALCVGGLSFVAKLVLFILIYEILKFVELGKPLENKNLVFASCGFFYFCMLPFMLNHDVNFSLSNDGWMSRFSSMALLPGSFIIAYLIQKLPVKSKNVMIALALTSCLSLSNQLYNRYCVGWTKVLAITDFLIGHKELDGQKIIFYNNATNFNVFVDEQDRNYELEACARMAYGVETKTKFDNHYIPGDDLLDADYVMIINKNPVITGMNFPILNKLFFPRKYEIFKRDMLDIKVVKAKDYSTF